MKLNLHDVLEDYYLHGKNYAEIARKHACSRQYIQQLCTAKTSVNLEAKAGFYKQFLSIKDRLPMNEQIKIARILQGKTQSEVAKEVGLAQSYYCNLENKLSASYYYKTIADCLCIS
tara:strand:- start:190 stop:540 length:351 start_codon:yes stop_codon:yes gene_type:complete